MNSIEIYFDEIQKEVEKNYELANLARAKGFDPASEVEIPLATTLAEKAVGLISAMYKQLGKDKLVVKRILELEKEYGSLDPAVALKIAEEIAKEKFCKFSSHLEAIEAGARVAIAYLTLGVVSSPIEGFVNLELNKTNSGKDYFVVNYAGPIRSAGGTEAAFSVVILDYLRETFGFEKYDPTEDEVKRGIHESYMYHERITNLQYLPSEAEIEMLMKNLPVQISGDPSEKFEVYNYKDLKRVKTNLLRSGFCLTLNEGVALKAPKILKRIKKLKEKGFALSSWDWLDEFVSFQTKLKEGKSSKGGSGATYIKDLVAGRPVFGHPARSGAFRLRYGRARNTGYSTLALHPATMAICGDFIAVGTQLKIEKPTKGCTVASCTSISGPIVKLKDGSVKYVNDFESARELYDKVSEIIFLGDLLIPYGDYVNRNHALDKPAWIEQYWQEELLEKGIESDLIVDFNEAISLSEKTGIGLHPNFIFFWREITRGQLISLIDWIQHGEIRENIFTLPYSHIDKERFSSGKRALELIGCEHNIATTDVLISNTNALALFSNLGMEFRKDIFENEVEKLIKTVNLVSSENVLKIINSLSKYKINDKSGTFIGARMGRPEKAKLRKLTGSPHVLFPVGDQGGRLRSFQEAIEVGFVRGEFPNYFCLNCNFDSAYRKCSSCGEFCEIRENEGLSYSERKLDIRREMEMAKKLVGVREEEIPLVKGVRGTSNKDHSCEYLGKGLLRAKYNLNVNKDGTIRYDISEMPLTHFKPKEVGTTVEKLKSLGYLFDIYGKELVDENQVLEIFPHDIVLPACPETLDEKADDVFFKVSKFIDEELERIYGLNKFFNAQSPKDLIGCLLGCMAPHNCAAVVGRLIGFSKTQALLASPYIHAAMRRDCDGDEAAVMLLMDMLINFSRSFLPGHRGGTQDAPLVLNSRIRAGEVDDMIFDVDVSKKIPLELYRAANEEKSPYDVKMEQVKGRLGTDKEFSDLWFAYDTEDINLGPICSSYKSLPTMSEKVDKMMDVCKKIRAVDTSDTARLMIERHFIRDTRGNLRKFSQQGFRCVGCNEKFRRPPFSGKCTRCGGKILFTISEGSILKYMQPALNLAREYGVSKYLLESLELTESYIQSIFGKEKEKQESINKWF